MRWLFLSLLLSFLSLTSARSYVGDKLLVVLEDAGQKDKYSQLWSDLESRGFKVSFESPKSDKLSLFTHGELAYSHLILLPPSSKAYGPSLTPNILLDYLKADGNILLALSGASATPSQISSLLLELDIHLPPERNAVVVDHFNYDKSTATDKHDVLLVQAPKPLRSDARNFFNGDGVIAVPRAVGQTLGNASPLLAPILKAPSTAYSYNPKDDSEGLEDLFGSGEQLTLVSAMQARNSARLSVIGSVEMLQDQWFDAKVRDGGKNVQTKNRDFAKQLTEWTFKEVGVLKVGRLFHHLNEGDSTGNSSAIARSELNPTIYRIKNDVTYNIELSEWDRSHLIPFEVPSTDALQLEFSMLSPFHRLPLKPASHTANSTLYTTSFVLPDQHGIFNFRVNYKRPFLTTVDEKNQVTVRHFAHDEWPRSWAISGAWVWIAGIAVTIVGWSVFVAVWLYSEPPRNEQRAKKVQ